MDIDFLSSSPEPRQEQPVNYSSSSDVFDFLSGPTNTATSISTPQPPTQSLQQNYSNGLNFGLLGTNDNAVPQTQSISLQPTNQQQTANSNFLFTANTPPPSYNYQQPPLQTNPPSAFSFTQQPPQIRPPLPAQNISISLNTPSQVPLLLSSPNQHLLRWT